MESGWRNLFSSDNGAGSGDGGGSGGQNSNFTNNAWEASVAHAFLFSDNNIQHLQAGSGSTRRSNPDPHMMCLELGKRHYCEDAVVPLLGDRHVGVDKLLPYPCSMISDGGTSTRNTVWATTPVVTVGSAPAAVVRCQVEGCHVALNNVKEYYRRHKVCEVHSKAPNVVVSGLQQRFCQQCSRFHGIREFDEAKRSCRRRLAGHNQRRRKGTHSLSSNSPLSIENNITTNGQLLPLPSSPPPLNTGRAHSLLSSPKTEPCVASSDLSSRCSAALCELIAENRATAFFRPYWHQNSSSHQSVVENSLQTPPDMQMWDRINECGSHDHET